MRLMLRKIIINMNPYFPSVLMFITIKNSYFTNQCPRKKWQRGLYLVAIVSLLTCLIAFGSFWSIMGGNRFEDLIGWL